MTLSMLTDVGNSTLKDTTHKGPNQGGNKSLLSYNSSIGVPGYTGFISAPYTIKVPIKVFEHTGRPVETEFKEATIKATVQPKAQASEYTATFHKKPRDTPAFSRSGGGYWITKHQATEKVPFTGSTTYKEEMLKAAENTSKQLERSLGLPSTLAQYEAARLTAPRAQSADPSLFRTGRPGQALTPYAATQRPATCTTSQGELVGYQTTNAAKFVVNPLTGGAAAPGAPRTRQDPNPNNEIRYQTMPCAMPPGMFGASSSFTKDFGADGSDPMERAAPSERFQTRCTTGKDLSAGTSRATNNPPGYTGHIAGSRYNVLAKAQSSAPDERVDIKSDMLLFNLDQFSRSRVPAYTGFKPQAARNVTLQQPSQGPPKQTTQGAANLQATRFGVPQSDHTHHNNSRAGIMTFFANGTGESVSDNGLSNAQVYYKLCKTGNNFHHSQLPHVTHYGLKFNPRNSLV